MQDVLGAFEARLKSLKIVKQMQIPYMLRWVKHNIHLGKPEEHAYSNLLEREGKQDWQIRQGSMP